MLSVNLLISISIEKILILVNSLLELVAKLSLTTGLCLLNHTLKVLSSSQSYQAKEIWSKLRQAVPEEQA